MTVNKNDFFRQATLRICGSLDIEIALWRFLLYIQSVMPVDWIGFHLYEPGLGAMRAIAEAHASEGKKVDTIIPLPKEAREFIEKRVQPDVWIINRSESNPVIWSVANFFGRPDCSVLVLRLEIEGKRLGNLALSSEGSDRYSEEHARLLALLNEPFAVALSNALRYQEILKLKDMLTDDNRYLHRELYRLAGDQIIGGDFGLKDVMDMVHRIAPLDSSVLLLGESGTGKELVANAIHYSSPRRDGPLIVVNCGAIPENLVDSELFGHEKGAFTGAIAQNRGRFERANHGTIFLDEIGELPLQAQVRMLRVLENKVIERVGGSTSIPVDLRIIAATHRNLEEMVKANLFREDLWFRLNVFPISIPPLRERKADIPALVHYFIKKKSKELKLPTSPALVPGAIDRLMAYHWPGNVRELENVVERALILSKTESITFDHFVPSQRADETSAIMGLENGPLKLDEAVSRHIQRVLNLTKGKVHGPGGAAEMLGINPSTLRSRMNQLGILYGRRK